jgi:thioredoxin reductase (NADPH)
MSSPALPAVLYVDDEDALAQALQRFLRKEPYRFLTTTSTSTALEWVRSERPILVISDYRMAPMNGLEFVRQARELHPDAVYAIHSGFAEEGPIQEALRQKILDAFIPKPWDPKRAKEQIAGLIAGKKP